MNPILLLLAFVFGIGIGYALFYFRYVDRKLVDDLRQNISNLQQQLQITGINTQEYEQQNRILKEKVTELLLKNDDLSKITSELQRYYHRIKEGYAKALELVDMLKSFDKEFDEKLRISGEMKPISNFTSGGDGIKRF